MTIRKAYAATVVDLGDRTIRAICSTADVDMTGEVVEQDGCDLSVYKNNPIVLFGHDPLMPVGTATAVNVDAGALVAEIEFAPAGLSHKADEICALAKAGILKGISIGFDPLDMQPMDPARPRGPQRYTKWRLCEISIVSIPANPNAVITDKAYSDAGETDMPSTATKTASAIKLKGLHEIGRLAAAMDMVGWQHQNSVWEQAFEEDQSELPGRLAAIMHMMGEALIAMTAEEVAECLAAIDSNTPDLGADPQPDMVKIVQESVAPLKRKLLFLSGYVRKDDEEMAMPGTALIKACLDSHDMLRKSMNFHGGCVKALCDQANDNGAGDGQVAGGKTRKPRATKAAAVAPPNAALVQGVHDSHSMMKRAMNFHTKCMKALGTVAEDDSDTSDAQTSDGLEDGESKGLDNLISREQRIRRVRALALRHPPE